MVCLQLERELTGSVLDIGGGGEGIIGRLYGKNVTAIDIRQEELDEAPEGPTKLCMDACHLEFPEESFDNATAFFSLMYFSKEDQKRAIFEAARVLRPGGTLQIWDAKIAAADPFLIDLQIDLCNEHVCTSYGVYKENAKQNANDIAERCQQAGFRLVRKEEREEWFFLHCTKG